MSLKKIFFNITTIFLMNYSTQVSGRIISNKNYKILHRKLASGKFVDIVKKRMLVQ